MMSDAENPSIVYVDTKKTETYRVYLQEWETVVDAVM